MGELKINAPWAETFALIHFSTVNIFRSLTDLKNTQLHTDVAET